MSFSIPAPSSRSLSARRSAGESIARRLVLGSLEKMQRGCLRLSMPNGDSRTIGDPSAAIQADIRILKTDFFRKCLLYGAIGFGESYVDGDWETTSIERVVSWAILNTELSPLEASSAHRRFGFDLLKIVNYIRHLLRPNTVATSRRNISEHYDLGNDFYSVWLDSSMTYSSAKFTRPDETLEQGQFNKYEALCKKLRLCPEDHLLEIGCGWGGFAVHAASRFGCRITSITISQEQHRYVTQRVRQEGLADRVEVRLQDYRHVSGRFDKIVSIEMMEALGDRFLETYCATLHALLAPNGVVALQYITVPDCKHPELRRNVDWIQKHIFPGSLLLSVGRVNEAMNRTGDLFLHELDDLGASYARTLRLWWETFNARIQEVRALGFDDRFVRKWNFYLQYCEAAFSMRNISVVHAVYTRPNNRLLLSF